MKRILILVFAYSFFLTSCTAQSENDNKTSTDMSSKKNEPQENIMINKTFDENGNLVQYDSTYTYYYSNIEGKPEIADSILGEFRKEFNTQCPFLNTPFFDDFFFNDDSMMKRFYTHDYFTNKFEKNMKTMDQLFMDMDSIKNLFFKDQFPQTIQETE